MERRGQVQIDWRSNRGAGQGDDPLGPSAAKDAAPPLIQKIKIAVDRMVSEKGEFVFFAAFLRRNAPGTWDLIAAAEWIDPESIDSLKYIYRKISEILTSEEMTNISRVVLLNHQNAPVRTFLEKIAGRFGFIEMRNFVFGDVPIRRGYIIAICKHNVPSNQRVRKVRRSADAGRDSTSNG